MDTLKTMLAAYRAGDRNFPTYKELQGVAADIARLELALAGRQAAYTGVCMELGAQGVQALQVDRLRAAILALPCTPPKGYGNFFGGIATEIHGQILRDVADLVGQQAGGVVQQAQQPLAVPQCSAVQYLTNIIADVLLALRNTDRQPLATLLEGAMCQLAAALAQAPTVPASIVNGATLRNWLALIHDNERSIGDRLQCLSSTVNALLNGQPYPPFVVREQSAAQAPTVPTIGSWSTGDPLPGVECEICDDTGRTFGKACECGGGK